MLLAINNNPNINGGAPDPAEARRPPVVVLLLASEALDRFLAAPAVRRCLNAGEGVSTRVPVVEVAWLTSPDRPTEANASAWIDGMAASSDSRRTCGIDSQLVGGTERTP